MIAQQEKINTPATYLSYFLVLLMIILLIKTPLEEGKQSNEYPIILINLGESFEKRLKKIIANTNKQLHTCNNHRKNNPKNYDSKKPKHDYVGKHKFKHYMYTT